MRQKEAIIYCKELCGNKKDAIELYAKLDEMGVADRQSNIRPTPSHNYAAILYHMAKKRGWI